MLPGQSVFWLSLYRFKKSIRKEKIRPLTDKEEKEYWTLPRCVA